MKKETPEKSPSNRGDSARQNPFAMMRGMLSESVGRVPARLVILLLASAVTAVLVGLVLKFETPVTVTDDKFPPLRVAAEPARPGIDEKMLTGVWLYRDERNSLQITFKDGKFELVVMRGKADSLTNIRYFARGTYRIDGDVLSIGQRHDMGKPISPPRMFLEFMPLMFQTMNMRVELTDRVMLWTIPPSEIELQSPNFLLVMPTDTSKPMAWGRSLGQ